LSRLSFNRKDFAFGKVPFYGEEHPLARLFDEGRAGRGIPLFESDRPEHRAHESASPFMNREEVMGLIDSMNPGLPAAAAGSRFVVAGQQPGLLTGPLYAFLKAVTAIQAAERLTREGDSPVLPLFWVASEDHDVLEVNRVVVNGRRFVHSFEGEIKRGQVPQLADIPLRDAKEPLLDFLSGALPETEFFSQVQDWVASADWANYDAAFKSLMASLFENTALRLIDPLALRPFTGPVLAALVERWPEVVHAFSEGRAELEAAGFEPPLKSPAVFEIQDGKRVALVFEKKTVTLSQGALSFDQAADMIREKPGLFSPGAALRPIVQDAALPVAATVAGPTELLYLWQIRPLFEIVQVKPSYLLPRISATFVESKVLRAAKKAGLSTDRIFESLADSGATSEAPEDDPAIDALEEKVKGLLSDIDGLGGGSEAKWFKRGRESLAAQAEKLLKRLREERRDAGRVNRQRFEKIAASLAPDRKPQERVANVVQFLNLYGFDFARLCLEELDPFTRQHQVVYMGMVEKDQMED
jgi:bacillithiol biosynthesis cysteine-adding enzyme BshC